MIEINTYVSGGAVFILDDHDIDRFVVDFPEVTGNKYELAVWISRNWHREDVYSWLFTIEPDKKYLKYQVIGVDANGY